MRNYWLVLCIPLLFACSKMQGELLQLKGNHYIGGKVRPFALTAYKNNSLLLNQAYASVCDDVKVELFKLDDQGNPIYPAVAQKKLNELGEYFFDTQKLEINLNQHIDYVVESRGCNAHYSRPVTNIDLNQDVDYASTIVSFATNSKLSQKLPEINRTQLARLIDQLKNQGSGLTSIYEALNNNEEYKKAFEDLFGSSPDVLKQSAPKLSDEIVFSEVEENSNYSFEAQGVHFDGLYNVAYEWYLDGNLVSTSAQWTYSPDKDSQGKHVMTLKMGKDNAGNIDSSQAIFEKNYSFKVNNLFPATPPALSISSSIVNSTSISLTIQTGASFEHCESFDSLALSEGDGEIGNFNLNCSTSGVQTLSYQLQDVSEGQKTIKLWAKDSSGKISQTPSKVNIIYDTSNPNISLTSPGALRGGQNYSLTLSASDPSGLGQVDLYFAADGINFSQTYSLSTTNLSSYQWSVPSVDTTSAKIKLIAQDIAGNSSEIVSNSFSIDSTAPGAITFSLTKGYYKNSNIELSISDCTDRNKILIKESSSTPSLNDSSWQNCQTTANFTYTLTDTTDGSKNLYVFAQDSVGNISLASSQSYILDQIAPVISFTDIPSHHKGGTSYNIGWELTELNSSNTQSFQIEYFDGSIWQSLGTKALTNGPHNSTVFNQSVNFNTDNTSNAKLRISYNDLAGNSHSLESPSFIIDSTAPVMTGLAFNNGNNRTYDNNLLLTSLTATDERSGLSEVCFNDDQVSAPAIDDSCWIDLSASPFNLSYPLSINLDNSYGHTYLMSIGIDSFDVRGWLKDRAGNISATSSTLATDMQKVFFSPRFAPVMKTIVVKATDDSTSIVNDNTLTQSSDMYIKWYAADQQASLDGNNEPQYDGNGDLITEDVALPANSINIYYQTNTSNWTELDNGISYSNSSNGACNFDPSVFTGCAKVTSKTNDYFELKLEVTNTSNLQASAVSTFFNTGNFRHIGGNLNQGIGEDATTAVFYHLDSGGHGTHGQLAVDSNGVVYFSDYIRGVFRIDPSDGKAQLYLSQAATDSNSGIGGDVTSAKVYRTRHISVDNQDRLIVWGYDDIYRVEADGTINKLIGGGADYYPASSVDPLNIRVPAMNNQLDRFSMTSLPNGDLAYGVLNFNGFWLYDSSENKISWTEFSGTGDSASASSLVDPANFHYYYTRGFIANDSTGELEAVLVSGKSKVDGHAAGVRFNASGVSEGPHPAFKSYYTSFTTGKDNKIYAIDRYDVRIERYNESTQNFDIIAGKGKPGDCDDNTLATLCDLEPRSVFVTASGRVYFYNRGRIRFIDNNGYVQSLLGQSFWYGDGGLATSARFGQVLTLDTWSDTGTGKDYVIIRDLQEKLYREFEIDGNISTIAGNKIRGESIVGAPHTNKAVGAYYSPFLADKYDGTIYAHQANKYVKLNRSTNTWELVAGGGSTPYYNADNTTDTKFLTSSRYGQNPIAINSLTGALMGHAHYWNGSDYGHSQLKEWNLSTGEQTHLAGIASFPTVASFNTGTYTASTADVPQRNAYLDRLYGAFDSSFGTQGRYILIRGRTNKIKQLDIANDEFSDLGTLNHSTYGFAYVQSTQKIYYCSRTDFRLYEYNLSTTVTNALNWPIDDVDCAGLNVKYNPERNSIIFPIYRDNLYAVAEIKL